MALSIKNPEADRLARELARETGEGLTEAVVTALRQRLAREKNARRTRLFAEIVRIGRESATLPAFEPLPPTDLATSAGSGPAPVSDPSAEPFEEMVADA